MNSFTSRIRWILKGQDSTSATLQTLLTRIFLLAINVVTGIVTARWLGANGRGELATITLWPQFLAYMVMLGIPSALVYNLKRHPEKEAKTFSAAVVLGLLLSIFACSIGFLFIPRWMSQYPSETVRIAQYFMISAPLPLLSAIFSAALESKGEFTISNQSRYLTPLLTFLLLGGLVLTNTLTPLTAGVAYVLPSLPITIWMLVYLQKFFRLTWFGLGGAYKQLLSYGLRSYGITVLEGLSLQLGSILVIGVLTATDMGLYNVAFSISRMLGVLQSSVVTVLLPQVAARPLSEITALTGRAARVSGALLLLIAVTVIMTCPMLLHLLYGSEFIKAVPVLRLLLLESVISCTLWVLIQAFLAAGKPGVVTGIQGIGLGVSVPLLLWFVPRWGLTGAGVAMLVSTIIRFILVLASFPIILKVNPPDLLINYDDIYRLRKRF